MSVRRLALLVTLPVALLPALPHAAAHPHNRRCAGTVDTNCHTVAPPGECDVFIQTETSQACLHQ